MGRKPHAGRRPPVDAQQAGDRQDMPEWRPALLLGFCPGYWGYCPVEPLTSH